MTLLHYNTDTRNTRGPNMEGCSTCASYDHGCCEDGLTPALGPDQEVGRCCIIVSSHVLVSTVLPGLRVRELGVRLLPGR